MAFLRLIRWQNLAIIFVAQLFAWWCVILPEQGAATESLLLTTGNFLLLSLSTVLIAAAGYIINDYFDIKIDMINRPGKMVLGKLVPSRTGIILHSAINVIAIGMAGIVAWQAHHPEWLTVQVACTLLLWYYSTTLKRQYMSGNVVVALLTAFTILVLVLYEPIIYLDPHRQIFRRQPGSPSSLAAWVLLIYAGFAFLLTWIREIVKDMEDLKGDEEEGCMTMPIRNGQQYASRFSIALAILAIVPLSAASVILFLHNYLVLAVYTFSLLVLPLIAWCMYLARARNTHSYAIASRMLKVIMVLGICSLLVYHFQINP